MWRYVVPLTALAALVHAESLYESLMSIEENENGGAKTNRVTFSRGKGGVKRDDMVLSDDLNDWLFSGNSPWLLKNYTEMAGADGEEEEERRKRAGTQHGIKFWPDGIIPYFIDKNRFTADEKQQIRSAMNVYEDLTCLRFVVRTNEPQWIHIQHTDDGCYSLLGDARSYNPGPQPISLQDPGCRHFGTYLHELGHAIGLVHEHQLPTRDRYVRYYGTNVDPNNADQLEMYNPRVIETFGTGYDLGSIMHYDIYSFSFDDLSATLGVDNPWLSQHIGRRYSNMLSFGDVKTVNSVYRCAVKKGCDPKIISKCGMHGYVDNKCNCITPQVYHQENCKDREGFEHFCEGLVPMGRCDVRELEHHEVCRKSCGFCPIFLPGDTAIGTRQAKMGKGCMDRYFNPKMCQKWKNAGFCKPNPWMHRYCRASCGLCSSRIGDCPNLDPDSICDRHYKNGWCKMQPDNKDDNNFKEFLKVRCADSCGTCGYRNMDTSCRNDKGDNECAALAANNMCEKKPLEMFVKCASTCNRCYWNAGSCTNKASTQECLQMGLANFCVTGGPKMKQMLRMCPMTCNSCPVPRG